MSSINPLGRVFNLGRSASGGNVRFAMKDISGVAFTVETPANASTLTITEQNAASGGTSQAAGGVGAVIPEYYTQTNGVWTRVVAPNASIAANVITVSGTPDLLFVWVPQGYLSDGFAWVSANHSAKALTAIMADIDVRRFPPNLRDVRA